MPMPGMHRGNLARGGARRASFWAARDGRARIDREEHMDHTGYGRRRIGAFGAGLALGLAIGAGVALLTAPRTGEETRDLLGRQARRLGGRVADQMDDVRDDLRRSARRGTRKVRRGLARGRRFVQDAADQYVR